MTAVHDVTNYGAGKGGDDSGAFATALAVIEAAGYGTLLIPDGDYQLDSGLTFDLRDARLTVKADGATVSYTGSGAMFTFSAPTQAGTTKRVTVLGGVWEGTSSASDAFLLEDVRYSTWQGVHVKGLSSGSAWRLYNDYAWCELNTFSDCRVSSSQHAINFDPQSANGSANGGTDSFARTYVHQMRVSGGTSGEALFNCRGGVYDSNFEAIGGNISDGVIVFHLEGSMGGTEIHNVGVENAAGSGTGTLFEWGSFDGNAPVLVGPFTLRNNITRNSGTPVPKSLDALPLLHGAKAVRGTAQSISHNTVTAVAFTGTDEWDTDSYHDPGGANPSRLTFPAGLEGVYRVTATAVFAANSTGRRLIRIQKNGSAVVGRSDQNATGTGVTTVAAVAEVSVAASDYVEVYVFQDSGGSLNLDTSGGNLQNSSGTNICAFLAVERIGT